MIRLNNNNLIKFKNFGEKTYYISQSDDLHDKKITNIKTYKIYHEEEFLCVICKKEYNKKSMIQFRSEERFFNHLIQIEKNNELLNNDDLITKNFINIKHPYITNYFFLDKVKSELYIEFINPGVDLFCILEKYILNNSIKVKIIIELIKSVKYVNSLSVAHRDLKMENVLISFSKNHNFNSTQLIDFDSIKLCDFGLSFICENNNEKDSRRCGSIPFCAPEIFKIDDYPLNVYKLDTWSLGIIIYVILFNDYPWGNGYLNNSKELYPNYKKYFELSKLFFIQTESINNNYIENINQEKNYYLDFENQFIYKNINLEKVIINKLLIVNKNITIIDYLKELKNEYYSQFYVPFINFNFEERIYLKDFEIPQKWKNIVNN